MEFFVPIKITDVSTPPKIFTYIRQNTQQNQALAVYPYSKNVETLFWMREHQRPFTNTRDLRKPEFGFDSIEFTKKLPSCEGILEARNLGIDYIVYFPLVDGNMDTNMEFFDNTGLLTKVSGVADEEKNAEILREWGMGRADRVDASLAGSVFIEEAPITRDIGLLNRFVDIENYGNKYTNTALLYRIDPDMDYEAEVEACSNSL
jgi:hypothetical protein